MHLCSSSAIACMQQVKMLEERRADALKSSEKAAHHARKNVHQRQKAQAFRLAPDAKVCTIHADHVSHHDGSGTKHNDLVFVLEFTDSEADGLLDRRCVDHLSTRPHDHFYTGAAFRHLFCSANHTVQDHAERKSRFTKVVVFSDNGLLSRWVLWTLSKMQDRTGVLVELVPLCELHAWSLCDSHGGNLKSILRKLDAKSDTGGADPNPNPNPNPQPQIPTSLTPHHSGQVETAQKRRRSSQSKHS